MTWRLGINGDGAYAKDYDWRNFLPKRKATRGRRSRKGRSSAAFIKARRPLSERPAEVAGRQEFGHWEADTMLFGVKKQALLVPRERASRLTLLQRPENKGAEAVARAMLGGFPRGIDRRRA